MSQNTFTRLGEKIDQYFAERQAQREIKRHDRVASSSRGRLLRWFLPNGGTILLVVLLFWAQTAGALPLPAPRNAPDASSTGSIAYQGRLADTSGTPITALVNMAFRIYSISSGGAPLWEEFWQGGNAVSVSDGLFNVMLGSLTPIPQSIVSGNNSLWLGISVGTDDEMTPRVQLGNVPFATQALTVPDGSVTTAKIAPAAVTADKLDKTPWIDLPLASGVISPVSNFQRAQYRRVGDIVYLRGIMQAAQYNFSSDAALGTLPDGFRPPASYCMAFVAESHDSTGKHRVDVCYTGQVRLVISAGTRFLSLDGIQFSLN